MWLRREVLIYISEFYFTSICFAIEHELFFKNHARWSERTRDYPNAHWTPPAHRFTDEQSLGFAYLFCIAVEQMRYKTTGSNHCIATGARINDDSTLRSAQQRLQCLQSFVELLLLISSPRLCFRSGTHRFFIIFR